MSDAHSLEPLLQVKNLKQHFPVTAGLLRRQVGTIKAVDGVSFSVRRGATLGIVGESGCGKSVTSLGVMRLIPRPPGRYAGGEVLFFSPILQLPSSGHLNLRNHRKMIIADHARVFSGGMNIGEHYMSDHPHSDHWVDLAFTLEGQSVQTFCDVFRSDWEVACGEDVDHIKTPAPTTAGNATVQLIPSGPDIIEDPLHDGIIRALHLAKTRIWIATPYFVPTEPLANALRIAALRGVDVRILVPQKSNQHIADFARGGYLRDAHTAGAKVKYFEPAMIHAKAALIDDVGLVGTANFDVRSMLLNFEAMLFVYDARSVSTLSDWFTAREADCHEDMPSPHLPRRLAEGVFRIGAPIL